MMFKLKKIVLGCAAISVGAAGSWAKEDVQHGIVYSKPGVFAAWPANEGIWSWGDEILVGFNVGKYKEVKSGPGHSVEGKVKCVFSRSLDGGKTWELDEKAAERISKASLDDGGWAWSVQKDSKEKEPSKIVTRAEVAPGYDFTKEGVIMKLRNDYYFVSQDKGHTWDGPWLIGKAPVSKPYARTNYVVLSSKEALVFLSSMQTKDRKERGRSYVMRTEDGGKSFKFLSFIGEDLGEEVPASVSPVSSIMPAAVNLGSGRLVTVLRQRVKDAKWSDVFESMDNGHTWMKVCELERGSHNPAALVNLGQGRLAAIYGWRGNDIGLRAKLSEDGGMTWGKEIRLREDGRTWDLGYPRAVVRKDGAVVIVYYYTTKELPEQHIAVTVWKPKFGEDKK